MRMTKKQLSNYLATWRSVLNKYLCSDGDELYLDGTRLNIRHENTSVSTICYGATLSEVGCFIDAVMKVHFGLKDKGISI